MSNFSLDDMVRSIVRNVTGRDPEMERSRRMGGQAPGLTAAATPATTNRAGFPRAYQPHSFSALTSSFDDPDQKKACSHSRMERYLRPCLKCDQFCNCEYTYFPEQYPDVLVRSVDKEIVRLSKDTVRASILLASKVDVILGTYKPKKGKVFSPLDEENVIITTGSNNMGHAIKDYKIVSDGQRRPYYVSQRRLRPGQELREKVHRVNNDTFSDLLDIQGDEKVLVLFDPDSQTPTLGISKDTLMKVNYYVCMHLDEIDRRVEAERRAREYFSSTKNNCKRHRSLDDTDSDMINTFKYEDWEEDFFNIDTLQFLALHQANQELLIWDLFFALEKWFMLGRGFPKRMVNGWYDFLDDEDYDRDDKKTVYGVYNVPYHNPRRNSYHRRNRSINISEFNHVGFQPRWWSINKEDSEPIIVKQEIPAVDD